MSEQFYYNYNGDDRGAFSVEKFYCVQNKARNT